MREMGRLLYLDGKPIGWAEDRIGSGGNWLPYGDSTTAGTPYATYFAEGGGLGLWFAKQRYYNSNWGRFLTSDPYGGSFNLYSPQSLHRYMYSSNDPVNRIDPRGTCDVVIAGITQNRYNSQDLVNFAGTKKNLAFPYSQASNGGTTPANIWAGIEAVLGVSNEVDRSTAAAVDVLVNASQDGKPINVTTFSGGAGAFTRAVTLLNRVQGGSAITSLIASITYVEPGANGMLFNNGKNTTLMRGTGLQNAVAGSLTLIPGQFTEYNTDCGHNFGCVYGKLGTKFPQGEACSNQTVVDQDPPNALHGLGFDPFQRFRILDLMTPEQYPAPNKN